LTRTHYNYMITSMKNVCVKAIFIFLIFSLSSCAFIKSVFSPPVKPETFKVSYNSPQIPIGITEAQFDNPVPFANLKKAAVNVIYYPLEDCVCLNYKINSINFYQFWTKDARDLFNKAVNSYNEEFNSQALVRRNSKTKNLYGTILGFLIWQEFRFTEQANSNMDIILGYQFKSRSPFFTITQGEAVYRKPYEKDGMTSGEKFIYLTKAQAEDIASFFDDELLANSIPEELRALLRPNLIIRTGSSDADVY